MALNLEAVGGRKFVLTLLAIATATAIETLTDRGITEAYAMLMAGLVGVYGATNVAITRKALTREEQIEAAVSEAERSPTLVPVNVEANLEAVAIKLEQVEQTLEGVAQATLTTSQLLAAAAQAQAPSAQNQAAANRAALNRQS